jgi:2-hydroxychromene-2-carboxylate isomerase
MRIGGIARELGVSVTWRAFLLGPIFQQQGWQDSPFNIYPAKGKYMWHDMKRICAVDNLEFNHPSHFPRNGILAARIVGAFEHESWAPDFIRRIFVANFAQDLDIADVDIVSACLEAVGIEPEPIINLAQSTNGKMKLRELTEQASNRGIFGAPTFTSGDEIFWGNERLSDALFHARTRPPNG